MAMDYFVVSKNETNGLWKKYKYFVFAERFLSKDDEDIDFSEPQYPPQGPVLNELKIQALNHEGDVVRAQSYFTKENMPFFCKIRRLFLIRDDIFKEELFDDVSGVEFHAVKVDGEFEAGYKLLSFTNVSDCVDFDKIEVSD